MCCTTDGRIPAEADLRQHCAPKDMASVVQSTVQLSSTTLDLEEVPLMKMPAEGRAPLSPLPLLVLPSWISLPEPSKSNTSIHVHTILPHQNASSLLSCFSCVARRVVSSVFLRSSSSSSFCLSPSASPSSSCHCHPQRYHDPSPPPSHLPSHPHRPRHHHHFLLLFLLLIIIFLLNHQCHIISCTALGSASGMVDVLSASSLLALLSPGWARDHLGAEEQSSLFEWLGAAACAAQLRGEAKGTDGARVNLLLLLLLVTIRR